MITIYMSEDKKVRRIIKPHPSFFKFDKGSIESLVASFGKNYGYTFTK